MYNLKLSSFHVHVQGGIEKLVNLRVLYISNNKIAALGDIEKLAPLEKLEDLLLVGNPLYNEYKDAGNLAEYRIEIIKRVPQLKKLDGIPIDVDEREQARV
jgi:dynein light chain 1